MRYFLATSSTNSHTISSILEEIIRKQLVATEDIDDELHGLLLAVDDSDALLAAFFW